MTPYDKAKSLPQIDEYVAMERARLTPHQLACYDAYRQRYEQNPREYRLDGFPPCLQIEPTSICNYRCTFCFQTDREWTDSKDMGMMKLDLFKQAIDEAEGRCEAITIASRGEPTVHPNLDRMLAYCDHKFVALKLNTNGSLLTEALCHAILQTNLNTLVISADAADEPAYSKLRVNGHLDRVVRNVLRFRDIREKHYATSRILVRVAGVKVEGVSQMWEMQKTWGNLAQQVCFVDYNPWENTYERELNEITDPCSDLWRRMFLWWDGTVNPCDVDYRSKLSVGKFPDSSLAALWMGHAYQALRIQHRVGKRRACYPCNRCTVI